MARSFVGFYVVVVFWKTTASFCPKALFFHIIFLKLKNCTLEVKQMVLISDRYCFSLMD